MTPRMKDLRRGRYFGASLPGRARLLARAARGTDETGQPISSRQQVQWGGMCSTLHQTEGWASAEATSKSSTTLHQLLLLHCTRLTFCLRRVRITTEVISRSREPSLLMTFSQSLRAASAPLSLLGPPFLLGRFHTPSIQRPVKIIQPTTTLLSLSHLSPAAPDNQSHKAQREETGAMVM